VLGENKDKTKAYKYDIYNVIPAILKWVWKIKYVMKPMLDIPK